jgi:hypothetical protein
MAYSEDLVERVRARMSHLDGLTERGVMSGLGFFVDDRLAVAVLDDGLCLRVVLDDGALTDDALLPLEFAGRAIQGWVCIPESSLDEDNLTRWVSQGLGGIGLAV